MPPSTANTIAQVPDEPWNLTCQPRPSAWVAELTGLLDLPGGRPKRGFIRQERPHPDASLQLTNIDGHQLTASPPPRARWSGTQLADFELPHRRRARAEDRIRTTKDTGLTNLPLHDHDPNRSKCALLRPPYELTTETQMRARTAHPARRWAPKRLRLRPFAATGRLIRTPRVLPHHTPHTDPGPGCSPTP